MILNIFYLIIRQQLIAVAVSPREAYSPIWPTTEMPTQVARDGAVKQNQGAIIRVGLYMLSILLAHGIRVTLSEFLHFCVIHRTRFIVPSE